MKWKIDNVVIDNQVVHAPMEDINDYTYREIIKQMGCGLIETEMISARAIIRMDDKTREKLEISDNQRPAAIQLLGSDAESFKKAAKIIEDKADIIDVNMGCPVPGITETNSGAALLKNPQKACRIIETLTNTTDVPITVKTRSGWDKNSVNIIELAQQLENIGISAITVHPRTQQQGYNGQADWNIIKQVKKAVNIPVIGNGDIKTCYDAREMMDTTNCDAVMIARSTLGNPWIITECVDYLEKGIKPGQRTIEDKINMIKKHTQLLVKHIGEEKAIKRIKIHITYYIKGLPNNTILKDKIYRTKTEKELFTILDEYENMINM